MNKIKNVYYVHHYEGYCYTPINTQPEYFESREEAQEYMDKYYAMEIPLCHEYPYAYLEIEVVEL